MDTKQARNVDDLRRRHVAPSVTFCFCATKHQHKRKAISLTHGSTVIGPYDATVPIIELNATGSVISTNSFGISGLTSRYENSSVFYSFDSEGNVSGRSDSTGNVLTNHAFGAHGNSLSTGSSDPFGFKAITGYYTDLETSVQLLTHRSYDPLSGRFLTSDPIGYLGAINLYSHVANNPVTFSDAMGEQRPDRDRPGDFYPGCARAVQARDTQLP